jgi:ubiquinone/menaquinone biosynthesis C-methylase UbiE
MKLPFPEAAFDLIICQFGVMFFPDKQASFREALRVLAPGAKPGLLRRADHSLGSGCGWIS